MADIRLVSALSKELWLLLDELLEAADDEDADSSVKSELAFCKLEISMSCSPFP